MPSPVSMESVGYRRHTAPRAALRELLEATLEWSGLAGPARALSFEGVRYRLTPLTGGIGGVAVLCESPAGVPLPEYPERRSIRLQMSRVTAPNLIIFTDAAHSALVWSWVARGSAGERVYRELSFRPGEAWAPLRPVLESVASGLSEWPGPQRPDGSDEPGAQPARLLDALGARIAAGPAAEPLDHAQAVQDAIAGAASPDGIRECWNLLLSSRVVDPRCGSGEWLENALRALVPAYDACLERMLGSVDDLRRRRPPPRSARLGDFSRLTSRAGGSRQPEARRRFATELALLHNLFGADPDPAAVGACRERLVRAIETVDEVPGPQLLLLNVVVATADPATITWGAPAEPGSDTVRSEDVEIVHRAIATILRMHLDGSLELDELSRATSAAAQRLERCTNGPRGSHAPWARPLVCGQGARRAPASTGLRLVRRKWPGEG